MENNKEYQKEYYKQNREKALKKACSKVCCDICGSKVSYANIMSHKKTKLCHKRANLKIEKQNDTENEDKLDIIIKLLNELLNKE